MPSQAAGYIFVILFIVTTRKSSYSILGHPVHFVTAVLHTMQAFSSRAWWLFPTLVIAGAAEVVGWVARTKSSYDATLRMAYIIQYVRLLILRPSPHLQITRLEPLFWCWDLHLWLQHCSWGSGRLSDV